MENKWEYRENFHSTGCGDYDGCYEVTDGHIFLCTNDDPEDIAETENSLQQIARLLNESGCKFYSNNALEMKQHIEILELGYKIEELQARVDRYGAALREIRSGKVLPHFIAKMALASHEESKAANEALSAGDACNPNDSFLFPVTG